MVLEAEEGPGYAGGDVVFSADGGRGGGVDGWRTEERGCAAADGLYNFGVGGAVNKDIDYFLFFDVGLEFVGFREDLDAAASDGNREHLSPARISRIATKGRTYSAEAFSEKDFSWSIFLPPLYSDRAPFAK